MPETSKSQLLRLVRDNRWLVTLNLALCAAVALPLFLSPIIPSTDLGNHVALSMQMGRLLVGDEVAHTYFQLSPVPGPYLLPYLFLALLGSVVGPLLAVKLLLFVTFCLTPIALQRLLSALGRSPWIGLWAYGLCWDFNLSVGFVGVSLGFGLALLFLSRLVRHLDEPADTGAWGRTMALGGSLALVHSQAVLFAVAAGLALWFARGERRLSARRLSLLLGVPLVCLIPWAVRACLLPITDLAEVPGVADFPQTGRRAGQLLLSTLDVMSEVAPRNIEGLTFLAFVMLPLVYAIATPDESRHRAWAVSLYLAAWALYLFFPETLHWPVPHILVSQRFGVLVLLLGLLLPKIPSSLWGRVALAPGIILAFLMAGSAAHMCWRFSEVVRPLPALARALPTDAKLNPVIWQNETPESVRFSLTTSLAYVVAERGGFQPHLFDSPLLPVRYQPDLKLPVLHWGRPRDFRPLRDSLGYDYVVVQGRRPIAPGNYLGREVKGPRREESGGIPRLLASRPGLKVELEGEFGIWQLYRVTQGKSPRAR